MITLTWVPKRQWSLSVCLCEQRPVAGSCQDTNEPLDFVIRTFLDQKSNNYLPNEDSGLWNQLIGYLILKYGLYVQFVW